MDAVEPREGFTSILIRRASLTLTLTLTLNENRCSMVNEHRSIPVYCLGMKFSIMERVHVVSETPVGTRGEMFVSY